MERGEINLSLENIHALADGLAIGPAVLFLSDDAPGEEETTVAKRVRRGTSGA